MSAIGGLGGAVDPGSPIMNSGGEPSESSGGSQMGGASSGGASGGQTGVGGTDPGPPYGAVPYCELLHALPALPVIDGDLEFPLPLQLVAPVGFRFVPSNPAEYQAIPDGVSMSFAAAWHVQGLYFYVEVIDPDYNPPPKNKEEWKGDGVEIYVDHDGVFAAAGSYDQPGTYSFVVGSPPDAASDGTEAGYFTPFVRVGFWSVTSFKSKPTANGYRIEAFIAAADLGLSDWSLSAADVVGFDLAHNISFPVGVTGVDENRLGQYFLQIASAPLGVDDDYPFYNSNVFCVAELAGN